MNRLYVTDLDGTLLNRDIALSAYTTEGLKALIAKGVPITYATSRSFYTASKLLEDIPFELPCITFNGVYVMHPSTGEIIRKNLLDKAVFEFVMRTGTEMGLLPYIFGKSGHNEKLLYHLPCNPAQERFLRERKGRNDKRLQRNLGDTSLDEIITVTFLYPLGVLEKLRECITREYGDSISVKLIRDIYNEDYYSLEISNKHANKGDMLLYLGELLGISMEKVTVFGDQANDAEMFRVAGTKVAVANAAEELKKLADTVTDCNDRDGVIQYLMQAEI